MEVRIYKPAKTAMQSGRNRDEWVVEFPQREAARADPLMGWSGHGDTRRQVRLAFPNKEQAIAFARARGFAYTVQPTHSRKIRPKSYADNFSWTRKQPWTH
ncbi:MAG: ETC complex I subunit [Pseudomonadota bacterium]